MKTFVNLLPFEYRKRDLLRRRLLQWSLVWGLCVASAAGLGWLKQDRYRTSQHFLETTQRRFAPAKELIRQRETMRAELGRLHSKGTVLGQLRDDRPMLTLIGLASECARRCNGRLVVGSFSFQRQQTRKKSDARPRGASKQQAPPPATPGNRAAEPAAPWATVVFTGEALDNVAVATFVVGLRDTGLFRRVELKSSVGKKSAQTEVCSFQLECDI